MDDQEYQLRIPFKSVRYYPVNSPAPYSSKQPAPSPLMFWILVLMATVAFAPCVVVPRWQDYRALKTAEQLELQAIEKMRDHTQHQELRLQGLLADPLVVSRLAQRELEYRRLGERSVSIAPAVRATAARMLTPLPTVEPPPVVQRLLARMPFKLYWGVYMDSSARMMIMSLCAATLIAAFLIFPPKPQPET